MRKLFLIPAFFCILATSAAQENVRSVEEYLQVDLSDTLSLEFSKDLIALKEIVETLKTKEEQSDKSKYLKNYQLILRGMDIIQELHAGTLQIQAARSQNIFYKKVIDMNNPASDVLGFQLGDVIIKSLEENVANLPIEKQDKERLINSSSNLVEGLKGFFPPLNIISSVFSQVSSFSIFKPKGGGKRNEPVEMEAINPVTKEMLTKIRAHLVPYIEFYTELDKANNKFQNALYQHVVQYKDYIETLYTIKQSIEKHIDLNNSIADQVNKIFEYEKHAMPGFAFRDVLATDPVKSLKIDAYSVFDLVEQYKKFTNDFVLIQNDFYVSNINILEKKAPMLPVKDDSKISNLITDLNNTKNGNESEGIIGFDVSYKQRLNSVLSKIARMNQIRY
jgi:hypothetical protein